MPKPPEEKKVVKRRSLIVTDDYIADTVVKDGVAYYMKYNREDGTLFPVEEIEVNGMRNVPLYPDDSLIGFVQFPSSAIPYGSEMELLEDIRAYIRRWVDLEERYEKLCALYVMFTYAYDEFMEVPYLRILADLGSGKSRLGVQVLGRVCYKAFTTIAASTLSPLFRTIDFTSGTMVLDEADLGDKGDKTSELVQMLNSGYLKGLPMMRSERGKGGFAVAKYNVFGPKIIVSREHFKDQALESRCMEVILKPTTRKDIPLMMDESIEKEAGELRNKLLMWRFEGFGARRKNIDQSFKDLDLQPRVKQLLMIMSGIVSDPDIKIMLREMGTILSADHASRRADTIEGDIVRYLATVGSGVHVGCSDIAEFINEDLPLNQKKSAKSVGWYLRERLGLKTSRSTTATSRRLGVKVEEKALKSLKERYGATDITGMGEGNGEEASPSPGQFPVPPLNG